MENWDAQVVDIKEGWTQKKGRTYSTWTCKEKFCRKFLSVFSYFCQNKHHFQLGITAVQTAIAAWIQSNDSRGRKKKSSRVFRFNYGTSASVRGRASYFVETGIGAFVYLFLSLSLALPDISLSLPHISSMMDFVSTLSALLYREDSYIQN